MSGVDVVIPCYKYGRFLPACVHNVLSQAGADVQALIIDDASPDDSGEIAIELARQHARLEVRRHPANQGHIATFNEGLEWVGGEYTLLISADDLLVPGAIRRAVSLMQSNRQIGMTFGRQIAFETDPPPPSPDAGVSTCPAIVQSGLEFVENCCRSGSNPVATPTVVVRTELLKRLGGYRAELPHTNDMELWLRIAAHAAVAVLDADQAYKRVHGQNMSVQLFGTALADLCQRREAFELFFETCGDRLEDLDRLRQLVRHSLAQDAFWTASRALDQGDSRPCRDLLDFAISLWPELQYTPAWRRFRWKKRIGQRVWPVVRPWLDRCRATWPDNRVTSASGGR